MKSNLLSLALFLLSALAAFAHNPEPNVLTELSLDQIINKASRQPMLSQRMAKCYLAIGMNINPKFYQTQLQETVKTYRRQLSELKMAAPTTKNLDQLKEIEGVFNRYESIILGEVERSNAPEILNLSTQLMGLCGGLIQDLCQSANELPQNLNANISNQDFTSLLRAVGKNRMYTQRICVLYLCHLWDVNPEQTKEEINSTLTEFSKNLQQILSIKQNTEEIKSSVFSIMDEWRYIASSCLMLEDQNRDMAATFLEEADITANAMHKTAGLYEKLFDLDASSLSNQGKR